MKYNITAAAIGEMAEKALLNEACAAPKPGLVDMENSGAHKDMDYPLFVRSSKALRPYFTRCAEIGKKEEAAQTKELRRAGLAAEKAMFSATGGVNTHKGLIFSMGILCCCTGEFLLNGRFPQPETLQKRCAETAQRLLAEQNPQDTHGAKAMEKIRTCGIRKEALTGFDSAFSIGLPALKKAEGLGYGQNEARIYALLCLMKEVSDSNVVYRGGAAGLAFIKEKAAELLSTADLGSESGMKKVREFDRACIERNLSPGGSADLLALSIMLREIFQKIKKTE